MTNQELIDKSLQEIGIVAEGDGASATASADALDILNGMMAAWAVQDADLQWPPQDTLGDTAPIPLWAEIAVISNLALNCLPTMGGFASDALIAKAKTGFDLVVRNCIYSKLKGVDLSYLPQGQASSTRWNINTDTL